MFSKLNTGCIYQLLHASHKAMRCDAMSLQVYRHFQNFSNHEKRKNKKNNKLNSVKSQLPSYWKEVNLVH